jgi:hypothetical protein
MIYSFNIITDERTTKQFYMTADNHNQLYKRILNTYGITKDNVTILEEYEETDDWKYKLVKSNITQVSDSDKKKSDKANELFKKASRRSDKAKSEYFKKYQFKEIVNIKTPEDLIPLIESYKKIKVYWEPGEKRGQHNYYAMVK